MANTVKNTDNRHGIITQTTIKNYLTVQPKKWFQKTFQKKKYYQNLTTLLSEQLKRKIQVQKDNKKYIPEIFLELNDVKEKLRYITQPILFYQKDFDEIQNIEFYFFNEVLEKFGFEKKELKIDSKLGDVKSLNQLSKNIEIIQKIIEKFNYSRQDIASQKARKELEEKLSKELYEFFLKEQSIFDRFQWSLRKFKDNFNLLNKKFILLTEKAGQGKTNLVCDFLDKVILKKNLLGVMFTGNEFNGLNNKQIEDVILKDIYGFESTHILFDEFLDGIEYLCNKNGSTFTIVIDGLNENSNIEQFSQELYTFVEQILRKDFIRLIFTCRSEYFDERFKVFQEPSFKNEMLMINDYMNRLPENLKKRLLDSYFKFFQVENDVFNNVKHKLSNDFLLLRIFCEVYGKKTNSNAPTEQVYDIYKDDLFKRYFDYKQEQIQSKSTYRLTDFQELFRKIFAYMLYNHQYLNIPFEKLNDVNENLLNGIIDEDIFFRKDLIKDESSLFGKKEVLNFTFDEFRDYLLADYLVNSGMNVESYIQSISENDTSIEGIEKYLFFKSRKSIYREELKFLEKLEYYDDLFLDNIFSVRDEDIKEIDIQKIKELFMLGYDFSKDIIHFLMFRHHIKRYKNLNIYTLFEIIIILNDEEYKNLLNPKFKIKYDYYAREGSGKFLKLLEQIDEIIEKRNFSEEYQLHNILEFMFLLLGVEDEENFLKPPSKLINLLKKYIEKYPKDAKNILLKYQNIGIIKIKRNIWELLNYYIKIDNDFSSDFCQLTFSEMEKTEDTNLLFEYKSFLEKCYDKNNELFTTEQKEFFIFLKEEQEQQRQYFQDIANGKIDIQKLFKGVDI